MKRERFLWPLTQSHHRALLAARRVREDLATGEEGRLAEARREVLDLWDHELKAHFRDEEEMVLLYETRMGRGDPDMERLRSDHRSLEGWAASGTREALSTFAEALAAHVRFEEDILFGKIEKAFGEEDRRLTAERLSNKK